MSYKKVVESQLKASADLKLALVTSHIKTICLIAEYICDALRSGGKIIIFGNGGSAADAQHLTSEFVGKFRYPRPAMKAIALTTDTSLLTAIGNDLHFDQIFARQIEGLADENDVLLGITTSGKSSNILNGLREGAPRGAKTICFSGMDGGPCAKVADQTLIVPSYDVPRIQEAHITIGHIVCHLVEEELFVSEIGQQSSISRPGWDNK